MPIYVSDGPLKASVLSSMFVVHEVPTPAPNGARTVFTTANAYVSGSLNVYRDQSVLLKGASYDYEETTATTFTVASAPDANEVLWCSYIKA